MLSSVFLVPYFPPGYQMHNFSHTRIFCAVSICTHNFDHYRAVLTGTSLGKRSALVDVDLQIQNRLLQGCKENFLVIDLTNFPYIIVQENNNVNSKQVMLVIVNLHLDSTQIRIVG